MTQLGGYREINQLRVVNNQLKHSGFLNAETDSILEFRGLGNSKRIFDLETMEPFYLRVKDFPNIFLFNLTKAIRKELYEFDTERIDAISKEMAMRMDLPHLKLLMASFEKHCL